jgi:hypothetical protein
MAVVAAADVMDMDKAECSISRILPVRHPRCRDNNTYTFARIILAAGAELIVLVFKKDIERRERTVTTGDILLQVELVGIA